MLSETFFLPRSHQYFLIKLFPLSTHRKEKAPLTIQWGRDCKIITERLEMPKWTGDWHLIPQWMSAYTEVCGFAHCACLSKRRRHLEWSSRAKTGLTMKQSKSYLKKIKNMWVLHGSNGCPKTLDRDHRHKRLRSRLCRADAKWGVRS